MQREKRRARMRTYCKQCGDPIQWVQKASGGVVPLMDSSDPAGQWEITGGVARLLSPEEAAHRAHEGALLFKKHPLDCQPVGVPCPDHLRARLGLRPRGERGSR